MMTLRRFKSILVLVAHMMIVRWFIAIAAGAAVTVGLLFFMQALISTGEQLTQRRHVVAMADASMPEIEMKVRREVDRPDPIEDLESPPEQRREREFDMDDTLAGLGIAREKVSVGNELDIGMAGISATDGDMLPLVNITPRYPARAIQLDIEGWCQVEFTVTKEGGVRDVRVVDAEPPDVFNRSSVEAAKRFRFQPRVVDGEPVDVPGVQYVFRYEFHD